MLVIFAFLTTLLAVRASEEADCEPQWWTSVSFLGVTELEKTAQTCFEYQLKFTTNECQRLKTPTPGLGLSLSFEAPLDSDNSQSTAKQPSVAEIVAATRSLLTTSQPFVVVPRSDRSLIEVQLQPILVADMQLTDSGMGAMAATTRIKLCTAARVPLIYGVCILQPVFSSADNVQELVGYAHTNTIPLPDLSSLATATWDSRRLSLDSTAMDGDSSFGSAVRSRTPNSVQSPMSLLPQNEEFDDIRQTESKVMTDNLPEATSTNPLIRSDAFLIPAENTNGNDFAAIKDKAEDDWYNIVEDIIEDVTEERTKQSELRSLPLAESRSRANSIADELMAAIIEETLVFPSDLLKRAAGGGQPLKGPRVEMPAQSRVSVGRAYAQLLDGAIDAHWSNSRGPFNSPPLSVEPSTLQNILSLQTQLEPGIGDGFAVRVEAESEEDLSKRPKNPVSHVLDHEQGPERWSRPQSRNTA